MHTTLELLAVIVLLFSVKALILRPVVEVILQSMWLSHTPVTPREVYRKCLKSTLQRVERCQLYEKDDRWKFEWIGVKKRNRGVHQMLLSADGERVGLLYSNIMLRSTRRRSPTFIILHT
ncbi:hypothetical protein M405DRAFT_429403 [Rhizopogon salebrosus TDB-379]|nr:hypothetical protein M405DRAFT_429403 [Rhizopogon salebrosus TDB-379]